MYWRYPRLEDDASHCVTASFRVRSPQRASCLKKWWLCCPGREYVDEATFSQSMLVPLVSLVLLSASRIGRGTSRNRHDDMVLMSSPPPSKITLDE